jgi:hypothetical protein
MKCHRIRCIREGLPVPQEPALLASAGMDAESAASIE